jgi:hypothetical protein
MLAGAREVEVGHNHAEHVARRQNVREEAIEREPAAEPVVRGQATPETIEAIERLKDEASVRLSLGRSEGVPLMVGVRNGVVVAKITDAH